VTSRTIRRLRTAPTIGRLLPTYAAYAVLKRIVPLPRLARMAWKPGRPERDPDAERRVIVAVTRMRQWFGRDADCVQASLVLYRELSRLGAEPILAVGFRGHVGGVEGHAWVSVDGHEVFKESEDRPFMAALHFGHGGTVLAGGGPSAHSL
jgi:hypothetical protein